MRLTSKAKYAKEGNDRWWPWCLMVMMMFLRRWSTCGVVLMGHMIFLITFTKKIIICWNIHNHDILLYLILRKLFFYPPSQEARDPGDGSLHPGDRHRSVRRSGLFLHRHQIHPVSRVHCHHHLLILYHIYLILVMSITLNFQGHGVHPMLCGRDGEELLIQGKSFDLVSLWRKNKRWFQSKEGGLTPFYSEIAETNLP